MTYRQTSETNLSLRITVVIEPDDGGFHAYAPALKGLHVDGRTEEEALENAKEGILEYLTSLARHGESLPVGPDLTLHETQVSVPQGALLHNVTIQWPSLQTSGIS